MQTLFDVLDSALSANWERFFKVAGDVLIGSTFCIIILYWAIKFGGIAVHFLWSM